MDYVTVAICLRQRRRARLKTSHTHDYQPLGFIKLNTALTINAIGTEFYISHVELRVFTTSFGWGLDYFLPDHSPYLHTGKAVLTDAELSPNPPFINCRLMNHFYNPHTWGSIFTAVIGLIAVLSAVAKLLNLAKMRDKWNNQLRLPDAFRVWAGGLELLAAGLFVAPSTAMFGGALLSVYLLAAIAAHLRVGIRKFAIYSSIMIALIWVAIGLRTG